ncbi:MAG: hypothetical protein ACTS22_04070 [Phycisphaerales bacterium]
MPTLDDWSERFEALAAQTLGGVDAGSIEAVASRVTRRRTAGLLVRVVSSVPGRSPLEPSASLDEVLLGARTGLVPAPQAPCCGAEIRPLTDRSPDDVIEVWTEIELAAVHSAWALPGWRAASESAARWLLEEIQPDNATNLPWAAHVFAAIAARGNQEARLYAETLLHNCVVGRGRPDDLSALILLDSAALLRSAAG